ncbi:MAG: type II toxin-antitoxin system RelE/ParE family toxin [Lachnospiraceae bacterium]|nr:type II toxin-antitoxin system RelE/ParE family toxin [Lachnospiraceae bacterium]
MVYKVIIMPPAKRRLDMYIGYVAEELKNIQAARAISDDATETKRILSVTADSLKLCDNDILRKYGYHKIMFRKHDYVMLYRIVENMVLIDGIFHTLQDYESIFENEI